jgi:adenine-specific DNA-methyltransferase
MIKFAESSGSSLRILGSGCRTAILTCALIESLVKSDKKLKEINLTMYETDKALIPYTKKSIGDLKNWLEGKI